jgi:hypothetical protein
MSLRAYIGWVVYFFLGVGVKNELHVAVMVVRLKVK